MKNFYIFFIAFFYLNNYSISGKNLTKIPKADSSKYSSSIHSAIPKELMEKDSIRPAPHDIVPITIDKQVVSSNVRNGYWMLPKGARILFKICSFFLILIVLFILLILGLRIIKSVRAEKSKIATKAFEDFIMDIIFSDAETEPGNIFNNFQRTKIDNFSEVWLQNRFNRDVILNSMLQLHKNLSGETATQLQQLYVIFHFENDSLERLKNRKWYIRAKAINELEQMQYRKSYRNIYRLINDPNETLRNEAYLAIVSLKTKNHLTFLNNIRVEMSDWEQLNLLARINQLKNFVVPDLTKWISGSNESIIKFSIKIIQYFNVIEQTEGLIKLLSSHWENVRIDAIKALVFLQVDSSRDLLLQRFAEETIPVKVEIINAIGSIGNQYDLAWLRETADHSSERLMTYAAKKAIKKLSIG